MHSALLLYTECRKSRPVWYAGLLVWIKARSMITVSVKFIRPANLWAVAYVVPVLELPFWRQTY